MAVVVAQLVEQSIPTPEIRSSNPVIGKILSTNCTIEKMKIKKKRLGMAHLKNVKNHSSLLMKNYTRKLDIGNDKWWLTGMPSDFGSIAPFSGSVIERSSNCLWKIY